MITLFENFKNEPEVGDYVIIKVNPMRFYKGLDVYLNNTLGNIVVSQLKYSSAKAYIVMYDDVPTKLEAYFDRKEISTRGLIGTYSNTQRYYKTFYLNQIEAFGTKEDMKAYIAVKKYNM